MAHTTASDVLAFWREAGPKRWFAKDEAFDRDFRERFLSLHQAAARGECQAWEDEAAGALALLILLDQFPRNAFRGSARMFDTDAQARAVARKAIAAGFDRQTDEALRGFFYLPFEHSEDIADQRYGEALAKALNEDAAKWARIHREIIERFGRFPHRNGVLGRQSTPEEQGFLDAGGFAG